MKTLRVRGMVKLANRVRAVAELVFTGRRNRQPVVQAMSSPPYQALRTRVERLAGRVEQARGVHHDLAESFQRVNAAYFAGGMPRPHLEWSPTFSGRKFGHYDFVADKLVVSSSLDRSDVPACAVDYVVYHELLHKKHGIRWSNGRGAAHTGTFVRDERAFRQCRQARAVLRRLATPG